MVWCASGSLQSPAHDKMRADEVKANRSWAVRMASFEVASRKSLVEHVLQCARGSKILFEY